MVITNYYLILMGALVSAFGLVGWPFFLRQKAAMPAHRDDTYFRARNRMSVGMLVFLILFLCFFLMMVVVLIARAASSASGKRTALVPNVGKMISNKITN